MYQKILLKNFKQPFQRIDNFANVIMDIRMMVIKLTDIQNEMKRITPYVQASHNIEMTKQNEIIDFTNKVGEYKSTYEKLLKMEDYIQQNQTKIKEEIAVIKQSIDKFVHDLRTGAFGEEVRKITILSPMEKEKIEEWSDRKIGQILFDSYTDDWSLNSSTFYKHVIGRNKLLFLVEDTQSNRFGCYIHSKITEINQWIRDDYGFLFSLYNGGFDRESKRYEIRDPFYSFKVYKNKETSLCSLGNEIFISKYNCNNECYIDGLNEYSNRLKEWKVGYDNYKEMFETKRFTVHQME